MRSVQQAPGPGPKPGDDSDQGHHIRPGTIRRIIPYTRKYRWSLALLLTVSAVNAVVTTLNPLMVGIAIDRGILTGRTGVVIGLAVAIVGLAVVEGIAVYLRARSSSKIGEGLVYDLRSELFAHVQRQPLAFFTRTQTGSLVSRLNTDVVGAQQAVTVLLSEAVSTILTLVLTLTAMFYLSWQISLVALVLIPMFLLPGTLIGRRLQRLSRAEMETNAELGSMMQERFNVAGAILTKLYGRPRDESAMFDRRAARARDIGIRSNVTGQMLGIIMGLAAAVTLGLIFGVGGLLVIDGAFAVGTLVALTILVTRVYDPIIQIADMQANAMAALVSFDRVFEVLDLEPIVADKRDATPLPAHSADERTAPAIEFDRVQFRYPKASEVSLASLESIGAPVQERADDAWILEEVSFQVLAGQMTALVGPSGAGKTTITHLVPRFYDPVSGTVRINGSDLRDLTLESLRDTVGVVTQDAHMFHETIRSNLLYARPDATEAELVDACEAARIWDMISSLPNGLDTVVGDRGYRLSGGEKQRLALARLLLKAPPVVVLDEATAHLDSESEVAIQRALKTALAGRTSLVIAHRLSTIREADQILVIDGGRVRERGTHEELLAAGGLYADLYRTQFAGQVTAAEPVGVAE
jgi:ATP-binding cassette subfamily B protein